MPWNLACQFQRSSSKSGYFGTSLFFFSFVSVLFVVFVAQARPAAFSSLFAFFQNQAYGSDIIYILQQLINLENGMS
jgi:hypothetical protein